MRHVWQKRWPHAVAERSVGLSMQMTQVKVLNVDFVSSGLAWALTASRRCFCRTWATGMESSVKSTSSISCPSAASPTRPPFRLARFAEGPGDDDPRFLRRGGESGVAVRSTYPLDRRPDCCASCPFARVLGGMFRTARTRLGAGGEGR